MTEILNLPDDLERKVVRFGVFKATPAFDYHLILSNGIPELEDLTSLDGFFVRPIEGDTSIDNTSKRTTAGVFTQNKFSFNVKMQVATDLAAIEKCRAKPIVLIIETSIYKYCIGSYAEPLKYNYQESTSTINVTIDGDTRFKPIRLKI